jgi:hypothetical protein
MQILATRRRIAGTLPHFEYRVFVPFDQISVERQNLIPNRSDYGFKGGPWARTREVIAPMDHLRMPPGLAKHDHGRKIEALAKRIDAILLRAVYPEMTATVVPIVLAMPSNPDDALVYTDIADISGRYLSLHAGFAELTSEDLGLRTYHHSRAA